jgi:hypothetical protein
LGRGVDARPGDQNQRPRLNCVKPQVHKQNEWAQADSGLSNPTLVVEIDPRYRAMMCYNCGEPRHFVGICTKPKICFICMVSGHYMSDCPCWKLEKPTATFLGSAGSGLGFYHI